MRMTAFAGRNLKEWLRDPLTVGFGLGFPLVLLALLSLIQNNIPVPLFEIERLAPGVAAFGLTFIALFSALLVSRDRSRSLLMRLCASPMTAADFLAGYTLPLLPMAAVQIALCYAAATLAGLEWSPRMLVSLLTLLPAAVMYIALGLIFGTLLNDRQVGGVCGAALTNVCAWLSGVWFDLELLGDGFVRVAKLLPFPHSVIAARAAMAGDTAAVAPSLAVVCLWAAALFAFAVFLFRRRLRAGKL